MSHKLSTAIVTSLNKGSAAFADMDNESLFHVLWSTVTSGRAAARAYLERGKDALKQLAAALTLKAKAEPEAAKAVYKALSNVANEVEAPFRVVSVPTGVKGAPPVYDVKSADEVKSRGNTRKNRAAPVTSSAPAEPVESESESETAAPSVDERDAIIADLRAQLAERDATIAELRMLLTAPAPARRAAAALAA